MPKHDTQTIWYEPHPVSSERKAAIRAYGLRIIDAAFKPSDYQNPEIPELLAEHEKQDEPGESEQIAEIKAKLDAASVKYHHKAGLQKPQELLAEHEK